MQTTLNHVRIAGISTAVPKNNQKIIESEYQTESTRKRFIAATGIENRRSCLPEQYVSDLAYAAADRLIDELGWDRSEIDSLILVTQTPDMPLPATACVLQDRLGLSKECSAFDVNQGCAGYPYGLHIAGCQLRSQGPKRAILIVGDTAGKINLPSRDATTAPLFGDAVSATALEWSENATPMYFQFGTDGAGWDVIMARRPGGNPPMNKENFLYEELPDGTIRVGGNFRLQGENVFNFSTRIAPEAVKNMLSYSAQPIESIDYFVFHQANKMINDVVRKRLKLENERVPSSLAQFGNTSSASIPVTMQLHCKEDLVSKPLSFILCGFGVGLSWATVHCQTDRIVMPELVEI
jgi:3-oxoacyl-[acyl-carrier-protein] synthase-3